MQWLWDLLNSNDETNQKIAFVEKWLSTLVYNAA